MSDFDDLIPGSRPALNPTLDNPFEDPFADVVRPRSPDPWSMASSYYQQPYVPEPEPELYASVTVAHPVDETLVIEKVMSPTVPVREEHDTPRIKSGDKSGDVDPLDVSSSPKLPSEEAPIRRNPLGPLPVVPREPTRPESILQPAMAEETPDRHQVLTDKPKSPETSISNSASSPVSPPDAGHPVGVISSTPHSTETPPDPSPSMHPTSWPSLEPLRPSSSPSEPQSPPSISTPHMSSSSPAPRSNSASSLSQENAEITTPHYDRIVSPLQTPYNLGSHTALDQSFSGLTLGGEVPGWGNASSLSASSVNPPAFAQNPRSEEDDDDEDNQPLVRAQSLDARSVATVRDGGLSHGAPNTKPMFKITVGDPQKVGDPISAHIVYTVSTQTSSPDFKKSTFSVLRRYSDFLWLYEALVSNNPGVVVPPVPEKVSFGRFEGSFVESRRLALNKCIQKIVNHPRLCQDPDLKLFLESDSFALDIKHRKADGSQGTGLMATIGSSITGPKFYETDEWFDKKKTYFDTLESQLKGVVKSIEAVAKQRAEVITSTMEFSEAINALAASDLSKQLSNSLGVLAEVEKKAKELQEEQAKDDMVTILGTVEEYIRLVSSVRLTFSSRIKAFYSMKSAEAERNRVRVMHEKTLRQRGLDRQSMMPLHREIEAVEAKAQEARSEYEDVTKLIKIEVGRFELERVGDFKASLEAFLEGMIARQNDVIDSWEQYQQFLLRRAGMNPSGGPQSLQELE